MKMRTLAPLLLTISASAATVTYHKHVAPVLQSRCQSCHRPGEIGPMPLLTYQQVRPWAKAIKASVIQQKMPPWFADPQHGKFLNDRSLTPSEIKTLVAWADAGAPEGDPRQAPKPVEWAEGWSIGKPDLVIELPKPFPIPASGTVPYQYIIVSTGFTEDKWVQAVELRPGNRAAVHHINVSAQLPNKGLGRTAKRGEYFSFSLETVRAAARGNTEPPQFAADPESELLETYVPGGVAPALQPGQARLIKAGSELLFQLHYTTNGKEQEDRTRIGFIFAKQPVRERIKNVLVYNTNFTIPANASNHQLEARALIKNDIKMVSMLPHMHLRGRDFTFRVEYPDGTRETLLHVPRYDFNWQLSYYLEKPKILPKGSVVEVSGHYDNSRNNPANPDPNAEVHYGEQTWDEMLNGFMEVALPPEKTTPQIFDHAPAKPASGKSGTAAKATFHRDVLPILQANCQGCHRTGEIGPMPLLTYRQARPWAKAIRESVVQRKMPPWFADPAIGKFANDRRLSAKDIEILVDWADGGAPEGDPKDAPPRREFTEGWTIGQPDLVIELPTAFEAPASGTIPYQYIVAPTGLTEDRWVEAAEVRPGNRAIVHHVIAFARSGKLPLLFTGKPGEFLNAEQIGRAFAHKPGTPEPKMFDSGLDSEALSVYVPGYNPPILKPGQAKLVKAGSVILFQLHYTASGKAGERDRTRIGLRFAKTPPTEHIHTVNVQNFWFTIPPHADHHQITAQARLIRDITIVSLQPHMHNRGKSFEYFAHYPDGTRESLLKIPRWDFNWQLSYELATPKRLPKGTIIEVVGYYDNSKNNPNNPDPSAEVIYGEQTWNEMLGGLFDVVLDPKEGTPELFEPVPAPARTTAQKR